MGWPSDPVEREAFRERLRAAQQARWARPEEREKARQAAIAQYQRPGQREVNAQRRREWWARHPEQRLRLSRSNVLREHDEKRLAGLRAAAKRRREAKAARRAVIAEA